MNPSTNVYERTGADDWSLAECFRNLYRRKATVAGLTCAGILAAAAVTAFEPRIYRAEASLEIQSFNDSFLDLRDIYPAAVPGADAATYIQTQAEALQQDSLLDKLAWQLRLTSRPEYRTKEGVVAKLRQDIRIAPVRNSRIIQIVSDARSPALAADLANTLARDFIDQGMQARRLAARQTYESLAPELAQLRRSLPPATRGTNTAALAPGAAVNRHVYEAMLEKSYHAWLASQLPSSNIRLLGPARPPAVPHRPNGPLNLAIGLLGGLVLGVGAVMLQEQRKPVLRAPGDIEWYLDLPELGVIPQASRWRTPAIFTSGGADGRFRVERAAMEQGAGLPEAFRTTAASILSPDHGSERSRVLVVTSCQPMEGKTTVVSNLGIALAAISRKVLLIDADLHRPRLHKLFDEANSWGLSDVLREKNAIDELPLEVLAKKTSVPHLYLLPSGATTDNIFALLHSGRMSRLLPRFRQEFDFVLVDAPPCLEFADARIMAQYAEEVLLVVRANWTDRRTVQTAVQRLRRDGVPLGGVILNRWHPGPGDPYASTVYRSFIRQGVS